VIGPSFAAGQIPDVIAHLLEVYVGVRHEGPFIDALERVGLDAFKARVYGGAA
jgi:sulfite reductase (NADPH) hemoprotein beta-component